MPTPITISINPPSLPAGYCYPSTPQQFAIDLFAGVYGTLPGSVGIGFNFGNAIPAVNDQNKPWHRTNADGSDDGTWTFAFGKWTKKYPIPAGPNDYRAIWVGSPNDMWSYDGGDGQDPTVVAPTNVTGSFWEIDTAFAARTLVGVGTLPVANKILNVGDVGGLDRVSLALTEMPPHTHIAQADGQAGKPANTIWGSDAAGDSSGQVYPNNHGLANIGTSEVPIKTTLKDAGGDTSVTPVVVKPHENMPPYLAVYVIRRTARGYYAI